MKRKSSILASETIVIVLSCLSIWIFVWVVDKLARRVVIGVTVVVEARAVVGSVVSERNACRLGQWLSSVNGTGWLHHVSAVQRVGTVPWETSLWELGRVLVTLRLTELQLLRLLTGQHGFTKGEQLGILLIGLLQCCGSWNE